MALDPLLLHILHDLRRGRTPYEEVLTAFGRRSGLTGEDAARELGLLLDQLIAEKFVDYEKERPETGTRLRSLWLRPRGREVLEGEWVDLDRLEN